MSSSDVTRQEKKIFPAGTVIGEDEKDSFVIEEATSSGGEAIVYKAIAQSDGSAVAVKLLYVLTDPRELQRFLRVKEIHVKVRGINILPLLQAGIFLDGEDKYPYFVTPFFSSGTTLQDILNKACRNLSLEDKHFGTVIPYPDLLHYALQAGNGLLALHENGVMHRDIKPSNILIAGEGTSAIVRLMDLGLSKFFKQEIAVDFYKVTQLGDIKGTPCYMAPEAVGGNPSMLADIWAFGAVLYELVTGRTVFNFESGNMLSIMRKVASGEVYATPIGEYSEGVDSGLVELIMNCLQNDPALRPQSMLDVLDELNKLQLRLGYVANSVVPPKDFVPGASTIDPGAETMAAPQTPQKVFSVKDLNLSPVSEPSVVINEPPEPKRGSAPKRKTLPMSKRAKPLAKPVANDSSKSNRGVIAFLVVMIACVATYFGYTFWADSQPNIVEMQNLSATAPVVQNEVPAPVIKSHTAMSASAVTVVSAVPSATVVATVSKEVKTTSAPMKSSPEPTKVVAPPPKSTKTHRPSSGIAPLPLPGVDYVPGVDGP